MVLKNWELKILDLVADNLSSFFPQQYSHLKSLLALTYVGFASSVVACQYEAMLRNYAGL